MNHSNLLHIYVFEKKRQHPKLIRNFLLFIILSIILGIITPFITDLSAPLKEQGVPQDQIDAMMTFIYIFTVISVSIGNLFNWLIYFVIVLIIAKFAKSDVSVKSIWASTLLMLIILSVIAIVTILIQWIFGLQLPDINIASLNIFSPGQPQLGAINIQNILTSWLFSVILHSTCHLSKNWSIVLAVIHFIIFFSFSFLT
ncbi:YIP1 family protein [Staphylococcus agnetis]|uniref:YIP1 family protein n=1 Tax=Staphylococcus agnetis TaxID=985762 RepID=UPI00208DF20A|nr:YIP1 family protein [Staphylococcus agnetis]MCO4342143.1 YIP1 family protein [Staphylococcus agnetis]MCO4344248.1 YIP1 family protein [Staphylococcus agnetis]MCO4361065.1 YIP1 family protein [Staphylococcus agnetis]MCO4368122.1 YIP1 family protein [Staphylococcus agnetis]MCO4372758.1 YIP1 family protein [Staphylococcus agnetis]